MKLPKYPLAQILLVKLRRVENAEKVVQERQAALKTEQEKLKERENARDVVLKHKKEKLKQLRDELDAGTTSPVVKQMKHYLEVVDEKLVQEEKKVAKQKEEVKLAEKKLEEAKELLRERRKQVDKIYAHKDLWLKQAKKELELEEQKELDEVGNVTYLARKRNK
jgi:hypothetical protein